MTPHPTEPQGETPDSQAEGLFDAWIKANFPLHQRYEKSIGLRPAWDAALRSRQAPRGEAELLALRKFFKAWKEIKEYGGRFTMDMAEAELEIEEAFRTHPQSGESDKEAK